MAAAAVRSAPPRRCQHNHCVPKDPRILVAFRRASGIGDLDPAILCAPVIATVVGDGFGFAVALGREPVRCDGVLSSPISNTASGPIMNV